MHKLNHNGQGRRGLGHITRSGVLMLCAAWELYIEELLRETVKHFCNDLESPYALDKVVQKEIATYVKNSKHELKPLELSCDGWKNVYTDGCNYVLTTFNSPNSDNINKIYKRFLGIKELSDIWTSGKNIIDGFVHARGDIAHKGNQAKYITIVNLKKYLEIIKLSAIETDNFVADYIQANCKCKAAPWRRRNI